MNLYALNDGPHKSFPAVKLNDTDDVRNRIIELVDNFFEYDISDGIGKQRAIDLLFETMYNNGFLSSGFTDDEEYEIEEDVLQMIGYRNGTATDKSSNKWTSIYSDYAFNAHRGSFVIFMVRTLLNNILYTDDKCCIIRTTTYWATFVNTYSSFLI